jgi:hypothetical protein
MHIVTENQLIFEIPYSVIQTGILVRFPSLYMFVPFDLLAYGIFTLNMIQESCKQSAQAWRYMYSYDVSTNLLCIEVSAVYSIWLDSRLYDIYLQLIRFCNDF